MLLGRSGRAAVYGHINMVFEFVEAWFGLAARYQGLLVGTDPSVISGETRCP